VKVKLKCAWLGHPEDSILDLKEEPAIILIERGVAVQVEEKKKEEREQGPKKPAQILKMTKNPPVDKQVKEPPQNKSSQEPEKAKEEDEDEPPAN